LNLAAEVVSRLTELDRLAKRIASRDLREGYNDWNDYDEAHDGFLSKPRCPMFRNSGTLQKLS
jgi:hypothetical protein